MLSKEILMYAIFYLKKIKNRETQDQWDYQGWKDSQEKR